MARTETLKYKGPAAGSKRCEDNDTTKLLWLYGGASQENFLHFGPLFPENARRQLFEILSLRLVCGDVC